MLLLQPVHKTFVAFFEKSIAPYVLSNEQFHGTENKAWWRPCYDIKRTAQLKPLKRLALRWRLTVFYAFVRHTYDMTLNYRYLWCPSASRESPAFTPTFSKHFPISASSAPPLLCEHLFESCDETICCGGHSAKLYINHPCWLYTKLVIKKFVNPSDTWISKKIFATRSILCNGTFLSTLYT